MTPKISIGLALGSGAGRGWAHIGILRVLEREGIVPEIVSGASVGALVGGVWRAGHLDTLEQWAINLNRMRILRYLDFGMQGSSLISGTRLKRLLVESMGERLIEHDPRFVAVATELATGHEIWLRKGRLAHALTASYALPGIFPPVEVDGRLLVDGALVNPIPVSVCRAFGARLVIAVNLNADPIGMATGTGPDAPESSPENGEAAAAPTESHISSRIARLFQPGAAEKATDPKMFDVLVNALNILQDRISRSRLAGDPPDVIIQPHVGHIGLLEFNRAEEAIAAGYDAAERALPDIHLALELLKR